MRTSWVVVAACVMACSPDGVRAPHVPARAVVHGKISVAASVDAALPRAGTLFMYWMTKAEYDLVMSPSRDLTPLARMLDRLTMIGPVDVSHGAAEYTLEVEPGDVIVSAVIDTQHDGIGSLLGAATAPTGDLMGDGKPVHVTGSAERDIVLDQVSRHEAQPEPCAGAGRELVTLDAPETGGAMGNVTARRLCVILPAGYATSGERRYPVVYEFPGWGSDDAHMITMYHHDAVFSATGAEAILVFVDTSTKSGSSYLIDSPRTGAWDSFVTKRVIPAIDARYRTIAKREGRATAGLSTGGGGALMLGLRHPEVFGVVTASAPDGPDITAWLFGYPGGAPPVWSLAMLRVEAATGGAGFFASYGNDWSPDDSPRGWALPMDLATGALVPEVVEKWRAQGPSRWLDDPARAAAIKTAFDGNLCLTVGKRDEFGLYPALTAFADKLTRAGIRYELVATEGGHIDPDVMTAAYRCAAAHLAH
jgi:S-formylglutathione hydrolase FrmB